MTTRNIMDSKILLNDPFGNKINASPYTTIKGNANDNDKIKLG